ncbi:GNAT family N-acetyltransferase [Schlegelella sp. S2-27]|uniref:GNAT family N-acetyltransferase n=1 Tax=Caldimonas mangrovi TaxID=2944811 RepID=A0ABT0YKX1_9BURK|nr:GNAT family protein [Caldimonas mangrovi]MCM5679385.1 GNAT family N-acetyltransferase [Caldimonas mangrovi]
MMAGETVRLRAWCEADLPALLRWRNDVALQAQLLARARGSNEAQVREWLRERACGSNLFFVVADRHTDAALGYLQFTGLDSVDRRADLGICLAPEAQGRGAGSEALRLAFAYLRETWNLRKVSLRVRSDNERAVRCYRRLGFEPCGLLREHVCIEGSWRDVVLMDLFLGPAAPGALP